MAGLNLAVPHQQDNPEPILVKLNPNSIDRAALRSFLIGFAVGVPLESAGVFIWALVDSEWRRGGRDRVDGE